jgi:hypothetical protein
MRGDKTAHGPAHVCATAYRRRFGNTSAPRDLQDLRPLAIIPIPRRWKFW